MKESELMIGDWVLSKFTGTPCRVKLESFVCHDSWEDGNHGAFNFNDVEPIPLTEDILKANAFEVCYDSCYQTKFNIWSFDEKTCVEYKISKQTEDYNHLKIFIDGGERVSIPIRYIHELQHALRLCGLNDLAENFKIE